MGRAINASELMLEIQACNWDSDQDRERAEDLVLGMPALATLQAENEKLREKIGDAMLEGYAKGLGEMDAELEQAKAEITRLKYYEDKCHDCPIVCAKTEIIKAHEELETVQAELEQVKRENETLKHALQNWHEED